MKDNWISRLKLVREVTDHCKLSLSFFPSVSFCWNGMISISDLFFCNSLYLVLLTFLYWTNKESLSSSSMTSSLENSITSRPLLSIFRFLAFGFNFSSSMSVGASSFTPAKIDSISYELSPKSPFLKDSKIEYGISLACPGDPLCLLLPAALCLCLPSRNSITIAYSVLVGVYWFKDCFICSSWYISSESLLSSAFATSTSNSSSHRSS